MKLVYTLSTLATIQAGSLSVNREHSSHPILSWLAAGNTLPLDGFRSGYAGPPMSREESMMVNIEGDLRSADPVQTLCRKATLRKDCDDADKNGPCMWAKMTTNSELKCSAFDCYKISNRRKCELTKDYFYGEYCEWHQGSCHIKDSGYQYKCKAITGGRNQCRNTPGCDFGLYYQGERSTGEVKCNYSDKIGCKHMDTPTECNNFEARTGKDSCFWLQSRGARGSLGPGGAADREAKCIRAADHDPKCGQLPQNRCTDPVHSLGRCRWVQKHGCTDIDNADCKGNLYLNNINMCQSMPDKCIWEKYSLTGYRCAELDGWVQVCRGLDRQPKNCNAQPHCEFRRDTRECKNKSP